MTSSRRVLIVGINYWPEETGNAPYTTGLAEHLALVGDDVTVLTGMPYYPQWSVKQEFRGKIRSMSRVNRVTVKRYATYIPSRQTAIRRIGFESGFFLNAFAPGKLVRPDVVIGVAPSLGGAVLARLLARRFGVPYGLIFQDLVSGAARQSGMPGGGGVAGVTAKIEGWAARGAAEIAIVSDGFRDELARLGVAAERMTRLRNWSHIDPPNQDRTVTRASLGWPPERTIALHAGAMGLKQGLANLVETARLAEATHPNVTIVFMGDGNQRRALQSAATGLSNVVFLDPAPAEDFPNILAAADVLLVNERASVVNMSLPSKLTSYFVAGRPVVAAVSDGATAMEVRRSGAGLVVPAEQPRAVLDAIDRVGADSALADQLAAAGLAYSGAHLDKRVILAEAECFVDRLIASARSSQPLLAAVEDSA
jgi:colanic acid biosynthesis glycosyl transferase WcaI